VHLKRLAKLEAIRAMLLEKGNETAAERAALLIEKEDARYQSQVERIIAGPGKARPEEAGAKNADGNEAEAAAAQGEGKGAAKGMGKGKGKGAKGDDQDEGEE